MGKSFGEMDAWAKSVFGEHASVSYDSGEWAISTGIEERFSWEGLEDTPAYAANALDEENYGSEFARWCAKNGQWGSMHQSVSYYNACAEAEAHEYFEMLDTWAAKQGIAGKSHKEIQAALDESLNI